MYGNNDTVKHNCPLFSLFFSSVLVPGQQSNARLYLCPYLS